MTPYFALSNAVRICEAHSAALTGMTGDPAIPGHYLLAAANQTDRIALMLAWMRDHQPPSFDQWYTANAGHFLSIGSARFAYDSFTQPRQ